MLSYLWLVLIQVDLLMFPASGPDNLVHVGHRQEHVDCQIRLLLVCLFVFVALRPKSTAMVFAGRSVHLTTLFPGQA